jgi:hypothetical protein
MRMNSTRKDDHEYTFHLYKEDGSFLGQTNLEIDWEPALEWCHLLGIRTGRLPPMMNICPHVIAPIWDENAGRPYISGFRTVLTADDGHEGFSTVFPISYFAGQAQKASEGYVRIGKLEQGEFFRYRMVASPGKPAVDSRTPKPHTFCVREVHKPIPLGKKSLRRLRVESVPFGQEDEMDMPVFIPNRVLDEACSRTREAGAHEVGGILVGRLLRDTVSSEIMTEVTAEVPVRNAQSGLYSLSFTPESWTAARNVVDLRNQDELMLGWWHSHSYLKQVCQNCRRLEDKSCDHTAVYMSEKDCGLHRAAFYRAYNLALVLGDTPCKGLSYGLFGWRNGAIHRRGFRILHPGKTGDRATKVLPAKGTGGDRDAG